MKKTKNHSIPKWYAIEIDKIEAQLEELKNKIKKKFRGEFKE